jgi:diguanylate cyclase (GGDEF)-like protein/putative nucleotidyltransferase with HDIG domain
VSWSQLPFRCRAYLLGVYIAAFPISVLCFVQNESQPSRYWILFATASFFVAAISIRLPQNPSVLLSMGDVFTVFVLVKFGPGPGLITYWSNVVATAAISYLRRFGRRFTRHILFHRLIFNLAACSLSIYLMWSTYVQVTSLTSGSRLAQPFGLMSVALVWFLVNTGSLSLAVSLSSGTRLMAVWRRGLGLYLFNFFGSCALAGILSILYERTDFTVFLLCIPLAAILYQLHSYYVQKGQQAEQHISALNKLYLQTIEALAAAVDAKDKYTHGHIRRVQALATELAARVGVADESELMAIRTGALLHDIGKIAIPEYILNKPTILTDSEYAKMRRHPVVGSNMLKNIEFPYPVVPVVRSHHERWDGKGYPDGLRAEQIPLGARILAITDCYDALTTDRPYRSPMKRHELVEFFRAESGKSYDPNLVDALVANIEHLEQAAENSSLESLDVWEMTDQVSEVPSSVRSLPKVQPINIYGKALTGNTDAQAHLFSAFEFARANIQCLIPRDVFAFMGRKLEELVQFDAAVFYLADLERGVVIADHVLGVEGPILRGLTLPLEKKLTGWVASNNQPLCNLPPFPDFLGCAIQPPFEISAIAPMNRNGVIWGAISLYRTTKSKFSDEEFRRVEVVASQTALALSNCNVQEGLGALVDPSTGLPNGYHLHLMFDQLVVDAQKFDYPFALIVFRLDDRTLRRRWGFTSGEEAIRAAANVLRKEFREDDLLVRYAADEFFAIVPRVDRNRAEGLQTRIQGELTKIRIPARSGAQISIPLEAGVAMFPEDGLDVETLVAVAHWQLRRDAAQKAMSPTPFPSDR